MVQNQSICSFHLSTFHKYYFFGLKNKKSLRSRYRMNKRICIIHVASLWRTRNILTIAQYFAAEDKLGGLIHFSCTKVTARCNMCHVSGHVMDENWNHTTVQLTINEVVYIQCTKYVEIFIDVNNRGQ